VIIDNISTYDGVIVRC